MSVESLGRVGVCVWATCFALLTACDSASQDAAEVSDAGLPAPSGAGDDDTTAEGGSSGGDAPLSEGGNGGDGTTDEGAAGGSTNPDEGGAGGTGSGGQGEGGNANGDRSNCKRGVAYGYHSVADLLALSKSVSWWYNWDFRPDEQLRDGAYLEQGVEYTPMIWGRESDRDAAEDAIPKDARVLLGFNEPNFGSQANLSAQDAAALWPDLEELADARGLRLVSPAVNFCGGDCQDTDPFRYLEEFLDACDGCRVDALGIHIYVGCSPSGDNKAEWLIQHIETYKARFTHPLWLTEFACDSAQSFDEQRAFLEDAVTYLEAEPRIERYAWFAGRANNVPFVDLLGDSGELTSLGAAYVNAPTNPECDR